MVLNPCCKTSGVIRVAPKLAAVERTALPKRLKKRGLPRETRQNSAAVSCEKGKTERGSFTSSQLLLIRALLR